MKIVSPNFQCSMVYWKGQKEKDAGKRSIKSFIVSSLSMQQQDFVHRSPKKIEFYFLKFLTTLPDRWFLRL